MARLPVAAIDAGWLAISAIAEWYCVGRLAFSIHHLDWLCAWRGGVVARDVYAADRLVWSVHRMAASGIRQRFCGGDGARIVQRVCAEFLWSFF